MLNLAWRIPVVAPATRPLAKAAAVAKMGLTPATSKTAATEAPRVIDPSAVISGK